MKIKISPSQIQKFRRCPRSYAWEYIAGVKAPASPKQEFGSAVHAELAAWLSAAKAPSDTPAGRVARQAIARGWLPTPSPRLLVEHSFEIENDSTITIGGIVDCAEPPTRDRDCPLIVDHKTTSDLKWAMRAEDLIADPQALVYAAWAALNWNALTVECRWVYYAANNPIRGNRKPAGTKPVSVVIDVTSPQFVEHWRRIESDLKNIFEIRKAHRDPLSLSANPASCDRFGGCYYRDRCKLSGLDVIEAAIEREMKK